jgi:hypothetical protein
MALPREDCKAGSDLAIRSFEMVQTFDQFVAHSWLLFFLPPTFDADELDRGFMLFAFCSVERDKRRRNVTHSRYT